MKDDGLPGDYDVREIMERAGLPWTPDAAERYRLALESYETNYRAARAAYLDNYNQRKQKALE